MMSDFGCMKYEKSNRFINATKSQLINLTVTTWTRLG